MSASYDAPGSCHSQETRFTPTAPVKPTQTSPQAFPLAYQKRYIWPPARTVFEAYKFYRAGATWEYAERTELYFERKELCEMINLRAEESTVECQYQNLSPNQRAQVSRLVQDRQAEYSGMVWSYVYAKENYYANVTRNPRSENFEAISMVIVLMGRPMESTKYPRTRMGVYVDLRTLRSPHEGAINNMRPFGVTPHWGHSEIHPAGYYGAQGRHSTSTPMERYPSPGSDSGPVVAEFSTRLDSSLLPVYVNGHYSNDETLSPGSHQYQRFHKPGSTLPVTGSYQVPPQLHSQLQKSSTGQSSRHSKYPPHYPLDSNVQSQKRTLVFTSATCDRDEEFEAPIPKRIRRLHKIHQGHGLQNQDVENRTS